MKRKIIYFSAGIFIIIAVIVYFLNSIVIYGRYSTNYNITKEKISVLEKIQRCKYPPETKIDNIGFIKSIGNRGNLLVKATFAESSLVIFLESLQYYFVVNHYIEKPNYFSKMEIRKLSGEGEGDTTISPDSVYKNRFEWWFENNKILYMEVEEPNADNFLFIEKQKGMIVLYSRYNINRSNYKDLVTFQKAIKLTKWF